MRIIRPWTTERNQRFRQVGITLGISLAISLVTGVGMASRGAVEIRFNRDIRPILAENCYSCHGPDDANRQSRLRLDSEASARADLGGGRRAITPGQPERSELIRRITHPDPALRMPPVNSNHTLGEKEIRLLTEWIREGARWEAHWAFKPPARPPVPNVRNRNWPANCV